MTATDAQARLLRAAARHSKRSMPVIRPQMPASKRKPLTPHFMLLSWTPSLGLCGSGQLSAASLIHSSRVRSPFC